MAQVNLKRSSSRNHVLRLKSNGGLDHVNVHSHLQYGAYCSDVHEASLWVGDWD